jgi:ABC-type multidrug transport system fused ATPase/permease subunit
MMSLIVGEGGRLIASEDIQTGTVLTVLFAVIIGAFSLGSLGPRIEAFSKASAAAQKIFQTLARIPTIDSLVDSGEKPDGIKGNIELNNVSFIYPARPEGSIYINYAHCSHRFEECQCQYSCREIHGWYLPNLAITNIISCRTIRKWKVHHFTASRTFLRPCRRRSHI